MAGGFDTGDDELVTGINVTPLVDVVLVLLVIFLMTAPVIYQSAIKVQLPKAKSGQQNDKTPFSFTINRAGSLLWDKNTIEWSALGPMLSQRLSKMGDQAAEQTAIISADESTPHGQVIKLMDALRQAGIVRFAMSVDSDKIGRSRDHFTHLFTIVM